MGLEMSWPIRLRCRSQTVSVAAGKPISGLSARGKQQAAERYYDSGAGGPQHAIGRLGVSNPIRCAALRSFFQKGLCLMFVLGLCHELESARCQGATDTSS